MKKIVALLLVMMMVLCACGSQPSEVAEPQQPPIGIVGQDIWDARSRLHNNGTFTSQQPAAMSTADKFEGITVNVIEKTNTSGGLKEFIEMVYVVTNSTSKDIKGIEGIMHIKDMFGKSIMSLNWDVLEPISANTYTTFTDQGISYNQYMDEEKKLYDTSFDALVFEYEFITVMFADGTTISK